MSQRLAYPDRIVGQDETLAPRWAGEVRMTVPAATNHLLVVEDNDDDVILLREALREVGLGRSFSVVRDGAEALAYLRGEIADRVARRPSLILLDLNMPGRDGFDVLRELKADPLLRGIPVVVLTASDAETDIVRAYESGACSYVTKPASFEAFQELVRRFDGYWTSVARVPDSAG